MTSRVNLPPGCRSIAMQDGTRYVAPRAGGAITVSDDHAAAIDRIDGNGTAGLVTGQFRQYGHTGKPGKVCTACGRLWHRWVTACHSCGAPTEPEQPRAAA
jgi:hypothetical protein